SSTLPSRHLVRRTARLQLGGEAEIAAPVTSRAGKRDNTSNAAVETWRRWQGTISTLCSDEETQQNNPRQQWQNAVCCPLCARVRARDCGPRAKNLRNKPLAALAKRFL